MTSARRPIDSPARSATGLLSSRDSRSVALVPAGPLGPAAGVVVMDSLFLLGQVTPSPGGITLSPGATLALAGERAVYGVVLPT